MNLSNQDVQLAQAMFVSSSTQQHAIGQRGSCSDGRVYRYVKAGAVDLVAGNVQQSPAITPNFLANTPPAVAIGATSFSYTPGASTAVAGAFTGGYLQVDTTPGNGYTYTLGDVPAIASATAFTLVLDREESIQIALTTSSRVGLIPNKYNGVIQLPVTTATGIIVGVASYVITAAQFGWVQTWGLCSTLTTGTPALGAMMMGPGTAAGAAQVVVAAGTLIVAQIIGHMAQIGVDGKNNFIDLRISP